MKNLSPFRALPLLALAALAVGCGGAGGSNGNRQSARAAVRFDVEWSAQNRAATEAESVVLSVAVDGREVARQVVNRPSDAERSEVSVRDLPVGALASEATSYSAVDGSGEVLATGGATTEIEAGETLLQKVSVTSGERLAVVTTGKKTATGGLIAIVH